MGTCSLPLCNGVVEWLPVLPPSLECIVWRTRYWFDIQSHHIFAPFCWFCKKYILVSWGLPGAQWPGPWPTGRPIGDKRALHGCSDNALVLINYILLYSRPGLYMDGWNLAHPHMCKPSWYVTTLPDQLSLAILPWVGAVSANKNCDVNTLTMRFTIYHIRGLAV